MTVRIHDRTDRAQHLYLHLQQHKLATLLGCWLCAPVSLQATVIVALLHPDAVYIAADSKKTTTDGSNAVTGVSTICKIQVVNGILYAAAGLDSFNTIFDLRAVITVALRTEGPGLSNKLALLDRNLREALATPVEEIKARIPGLYSRLQTDGPIVAAVFAAWRNGVPTLRKDTWTVTPEGKLLHENPFPKIGGNMVILGDGEMSVADYMRTHRTWNDPPPEAMLERLVKAAIEAAKRDPESQVGGEVSVVKLSANGVQWLRPGACGK